MSQSTNLKCTRASAALHEKENKSIPGHHSKQQAKFTANKHKESDCLKFQNYMHFQSAASKQLPISKKQLNK